MSLYFEEHFCAAGGWNRKETIGTEAELGIGACLCLCKNASGFYIPNHSPASACMHQKRACTLLLMLAHCRPPEAAPGKLNVWMAQAEGILVFPHFTLADLVQ